MSRGGSASAVPSPAPQTAQMGQASSSPPSAADSSSLEKAQPTAATPASEHGSSSVGGAEPSQSGADSAGTVADDVFSTADDVFSTADEVFSAPDSPHRDFHCAVLRALSKEPSVVDAAKAGQAPCTPDKVESCLNSGLPLPTSPAQPWDTGNPPPAVFSPSSEGLESAASVLPCASTLHTHTLISEAFA